VVTGGEVWWYEPPESKARPYLILTRTEVIPHLSDVLAIPATRTVRGIPTEVPLDQGDGMAAECVLTADNLTLVQSAHLTRSITTLSAARMAEVCEAIRIATGC
jgi:mRNA interferase MazF